MEDCQEAILAMLDTNSTSRGIRNLGLLFHADRAANDRCICQVLGSHVLPDHVVRGTVV